MNTPKTSRNRTSAIILAGSIAALLAAQPAHAATRTWTGDTNVPWSNAANWDILPTATDIANFNLAAYGTPYVAPFLPNAGTTSINGLTIGASNGRMILTTANLSIGAGGIDIASGAGAFNLAGGVTLGAAQSWVNNSQNHFMIQSDGSQDAVNTGTFVLTISGTGHTFASSAFSGTGGLTMNGTGILTMGNYDNYATPKGPATLNSFTGQLTVASGTLATNTINNASSNGALGNSAGAVILGSTGQTGTLQWTNPSMAISSKRFTMAENGTGAFDILTPQTRTLTQGVVASTADGLILTGLLDSAGTMNGAMTKKGFGNLTLRSSVSNTFTGGLNVIGGGTLALDFLNMAGPTPTDVIAATNVLTLNGGFMTIKGKTGANATSQTFASTTIGAGGGSILVDPNNGTSTTVVLGALAALPAGSALLVGKAVTANTGTVAITTANDYDAQSIYGARTVFASGAAGTGYDWATRDSSVGGGPFTLAAFGAGGNFGTYTIMGSGGANDLANVETGTLALVGSNTHNSLKITSAATLDLDVHQLTLASGGLLSTGTTASTISGTGALGLTAGAGTGHELIVHQYNTAANGLTISAVIGNNGANAVSVTKAGTGNLILSGTNTFTGQLTVQGGTLSVPTVNNVSTDGPLGNSASAVIIGNAGVLKYTGSTASSDKPFIMAAGGSGRIEVSDNIDSNNQTLTLSGVISGSGGLTAYGVGGTANSTFAKVDRLKLTGLNTYTGVTTIDGGILEVDNLQNAGVASSIGAYALPGTSGIVLYDGSMLRYTGPSMATSINRGITLHGNHTNAVSATIDLPINGDMRIGSLTTSIGANPVLPPGTVINNAGGWTARITGNGFANSRLYIDSVIAPTSSFRSGGVQINFVSANVTIGTVTGNGRLEFTGSGGDNIITGPINLGEAYNGHGDNVDRGQISGFWTGTLTVMSDNTFNGRWSNGGGTIRFMSPGTLISGQNVSYALGKSSFNWLADDNVNNYKTHWGNNTVHYLNDLSTSYETGFTPGQRVPVLVAGGSHTLLVDRQGATATNGTHKLGNLFIRENLTLTVTGNNGFGLTFDDVRLEDARTQVITTNTNLTLAKLRKIGGGTNSLTIRGTGTTTVTGNIEEAAGGTLNITKSEAGTLILLGANTTANNTTLSGGTLIARHQNALGALAGSNVTVGAGTSLQYNATADVPLSIGGTLGITGGTTRIGGVIGSTFTSAQISSAGNATATAANLNIDIYGNSFSTATDGDGTYTLVQGNGGANTLNNATSLTLGTVFNPTNFTVGALSTPDSTKIDVVIDAVTPLPTAYWKGTATAGLSKVWAASNGLAAGSDSNWTDTDGGTSSPLVPGVAADVIIASSSVTVGGEPIGTRLGADMTIKSLTISNAGGLGLNADPYQLTITPASSTAGITTTSTAGPSTIAAKVALGANQTWTVDPANLLTVSGVVSGASNLTKAGTGTLVFSGAGMGTGGYTGLTTVAEGTLQLGVNSGIRHNNAVTVAPTGASATLDLAGFSQTIGGAGLTLGGGGTGSAASVIGTGTLTLNGGATAVTYNEANDPLGATISATKILLADAPQTFTVGDSATVISTGNELTISSTITQLGALTALVKEGTGTLKLDGAQDYNILTVNDGTANVNGILGTGSGTAVVTVNDTVGGVATKLRFGSVSQTLSSLTIGAGATVVFTSGAASGSLTGDDGGGKAAGFGSPASSFGGGATVPEPGTLGLLLVGALGMLNRRRRQA